MGADQTIDWGRSAISVLDWWRDAGVDVLVGEEPRDWLARAPAQATLAAVAAAPVAAAALPDTIDAYVAWRSGADAPEGAGGLLAEGDAAAATMIVTDYPDGDMLLGDAPGRLFDRMLAAIGLARDSVYLVALTTKRPLGGRIAPEALPRLGELVAHHIALAGPQRVLLLGQAPKRALAGTDATGGDSNLRAINLENGTVVPVATWHPRALIDAPQMKAGAWKDLQMLMGGSR